MVEIFECDFRFTFKLFLESLLPRLLKILAQRLATRKIELLNCITRLRYQRNYLFVFIYLFCLLAYIWRFAGLHLSVRLFLIAVGSLTLFLLLQMIEILFHYATLSIFRRELIRQLFFCIQVHFLLVCSPYWRPRRCLTTIRILITYVH